MLLKQNTMTIVIMDCNRERRISLLLLFFVSFTTKQLKLTDKKNPNML